MQSWRLLADAVVVLKDKGLVVLVVQVCKERGSVRPALRYHETAQALLFDRSKKGSRSKSNDCGFV